MKAETREAASAEVHEELEAERQAVDDRTERLKAMRLAREAENER
jgi:hypothetical protein